VKVKWTSTLQTNRLHNQISEFNYNCSALGWAPVTNHMVTTKQTNRKWSELHSRIGKSVCSNNVMRHNSFSIRIAIALTICSHITSIHNFYCNVLISLDTTLEWEMPLKVPKGLHMWKRQVTPPAGEYSWINAIEEPKPVAFNDLITTMNHKVMETKRWWLSQVIIT